MAASPALFRKRSCDPPLSGSRDRSHGVTSPVELGIAVIMPKVDAAMRGAFERVFGATVGTWAAPLSSGERR